MAKQPTGGDKCTSKHRQAAWDMCRDILKPSGSVQKEASHAVAHSHTNVTHATQNTVCYS